MMKFLKTIRFDPSDAHVYENAASVDEWAISGGFVFSGAQEKELIGKTRQAFSNGFLSVESFGHSTFVSVAEISSDQLAELKSKSPSRFVTYLNAPSIEEAQIVVDAEIGFVLDLCEHVPINSVFATTRHFDEAGEIKEEFRIIDAPKEKMHTKIWEIVEE